MKSEARKIFPLTILAVFLISFAPMAYASTLTVNLNPKTGLAKVDSVSTTKIIFTYPAGSMVSNYLKNVSSSLKLNSAFNSGTQGVQELQGSFDDEDSHVSVRNMSVAIDYTAKGNTTALVIYKVTNITAWVSGVFRVVNGTVMADLRWRSFVVLGAMNLEMEDHSVDINLVGSSVQDSLASNEMASSFMFGAFGGGSVWDRPTLNFSALNSPLSTWTKNYDAGTNTTTFTKTINGQSTFTASIDYNGQKYSLSAVSDPTGVVAVQGYANAQGDSLVMAPSPASSAGLLAVGVVVILAGAALGYLALRSRARAKIPPPPTSLSA
ncbi:MAG: hypothetical protein KGI38_01620 [Thaumarchaeota archaeon]|nr:hypothetical protein [Nitrososphaerota archaeon]